MQRTRYEAEYFYPGVLFSESVSRKVEAPTWEAVLSVAPDEAGYFKKDGWYAVRVYKIEEKRYSDDDLKDVIWKVVSNDKVHSWIVGERVHWSEIEDNERNSILISNIKYNSKDGCGVKTRAGNWQFSSDWDTVVSPSMV